MKNLIVRREFTKNQYIGRLDSLEIQGGAWQERGERGVSNDFRGELKLL